MPSTPTTGDAVAELTSSRLAGTVREVMWRASPDLKLAPEWIIESGDEVTVWLFGTGTHIAPWTLPPSAGPLAGKRSPPAASLARRMLCHRPRPR